jgi:hypothetical protein
VFVALAVAGLAFAVVRVRSLRRIERALEATSTPGSPRLMPEALSRVACDEAGVSLTTPQGRVEHLPWSRLAAVEVHTNDSGPWGTDVWFVLHGDGAGLAIPHGATGDSELVEHLQRLPDFDHTALLEAMVSTENRVFRCWTRPGWAAPAWPG